ncbi:MAG: 50S ribosomal protein L17 [Chlorobium sp.]|jgi:large subunit ribosomal protein L17|uniref:50S ribosomal protein L17 n=1 Tax=Chlorobium sp. TaxID=1095 RepID=UPI001D50A6A8|nr:50S ribosomal protein L17 [Chlorobium sp.]MBN1279988.1 50S ribosomal protein L17 [Chlorobiaceae bacterium]MCF8216193.1 50S ribosomal protein L17 [Chlorobium sp.]MCF8271056.1 50S ribosomal protein L17 [Chlorobium sp.]MCF8287469.1 50S ribosomal protein L17 [Chlorobium sp.]MCF8290969.1 50S ribosomal protein L17 [Chlorobium sp.]
MRKVKPARKLGRTAAHRKATLDNLSTQLLLYKRIQTTEAKAKETRKVIEKIITKARKGTVHAQREIFKSIRDKEAIKMLFEEIVSKIGDRNGGYTRIIKLAPRFGDAAKMAVIELVDYADAPLKQASSGKQDRAKRVKGSKKTEAKAAASAAGE